MKNVKNFINVKRFTNGILLIFLLSFYGIHAQTANSDYAKALADSLEAKNVHNTGDYIFVLLKPGMIKLDDKSKAAEILQEHLKSIEQWEDEGKIVIDGRFGRNDKSYKGAFILNVKSKEEAKSLLETDPAIKERLLVAEVYDWYGSETLPVTHENNTINKQDISKK